MGSFGIIYAIVGTTPAHLTVLSITQLLIGLDHATTGMSPLPGRI